MGFFENLKQSLSTNSSSSTKDERNESGTPVNNSVEQMDSKDDKVSLSEATPRKDSCATVSNNDHVSGPTENLDSPSFDELNEKAEVHERDVVPQSSNDDVREGVVVELEEEDAPSYVPYKEKPPVNHVIGSTKILAIINQKGGVGKSTTAVNLAAALGRLNKEVLLVDLDPQGNATSGYGVDKRELNNCVYDVLLGDASVEDVILANVAPGVDVLPSTINLAGAEVELVNEMARENRLKNALGSLRGKYDYVLIDCPPSLGLLTINALVAADKLLVPIQCEFYALEGVTKLLDSMNRVKSILNPSLGIFGIVLTMHDGRTNLSNQVVEEVRKYFGSEVFDTLIPRSVKLSEAPSYGLSIIDYAPSSKGALAYEALAKEVISRG